MIALPVGNMNSYSYQVVDVFTREPLAGNPLAVFPHAKGLDDATMQRVARELNLSETVFVFPATRPDCAARVRIFTPVRELPFAGHPTVGVSFVLLAEGMVPEPNDRFILEEKVGPVPIRVEHGDRPLIWLTTPPIQVGRTFDGAMCADALGLPATDLADCPPHLVSAGNPVIFVALKNKEAVDRACVQNEAFLHLMRQENGVDCLFVFAAVPGGAYSRMFAPEIGVVEDPATGSATGPLAAYMMQHNLISSAAGTHFISEQGTKMGRRSLLHVLLNGDGGSGGIEVGGYVTPLVRAEMRF